MISRWRWILLRWTRRLWLRATLISMLAVAAALVSLVISPYLPSGLSTKIGAQAVGQILNIIASSMLAVTTFSLSTMVAAYSAATSNVTPRATKLLIEDTTTQNVLATFVGSFLYSLVGIITLSMGAYGERGRVVLFAVTIVVILLIVVTLLRWIDYLIKLGRVGETTQEVEKATTNAMRVRMKKAHLGGTPLDDPVGDIPEGAIAVMPEKVGYVQHVDTPSLSESAKTNDGQIYVVALPGTFVDRGRPLAWCSGFDEEADMDYVRDCFTVADDRSFDQDPRFGLCVMSEIASRALSPGINDPGTAIDVLGRAVRVLSVWAEGSAPEEPEYPNVHVPALLVDDLFDDIFQPIARDGAGMVEVQIRLQKALAALARTGDRRYRRSALLHSKLALDRVEAAMEFEPDRERTRAAAAKVGDFEDSF